MGKIDIFEEKKLKNFKWAGPRYYDYPDGEDLPGKLKFALIASSSAGLIIGGAASMGIPIVPKTLKGKLIRTAQYVVPCVGAALTFTFATYFSTRLRGKDDEFNYVIGGFLSGASLAALTPLRELGIIGAIAFPILGVYRKRREMNGDKSLFAPLHYKGLPSYYLRNWDYSLVEDRPGNWTREPVSK